LFAPWERHPSFRKILRYSAGGFGPDCWFGGCDCLRVTLLAPFINIHSYLKPVVPLPDLIQGLVHTQVTFGRSTVQFGQHILHSAPRKSYLDYLRSSFCGFSAALLYAVSHNEGFAPSSIPLVSEVVVGNVFPF
jgi:hypothetical protein